jgi:hypothetical protein
MIASNVDGGRVERRAAFKSRAKFAFQANAGVSNCPGKAAQPIEKVEFAPEYGWLTPEIGPKRPVGKVRQRPVPLRARLPRSRGSRAALSARIGLRSRAKRSAHASAPCGLAIRS